MLAFYCFFVNKKKVFFKIDFEKVGNDLPNIYRKI